MRHGRLKQTSGWVDQLSDYLNLLTFSARTPTLALGLVLLANSIGLVQTVKGGHSTCCVCGSQNPGIDMPNSLSINTDFPVPSSTETATSSTGKSTLYCRFSGSWEREISPLGQIHPSQPPASSCVSRPRFYHLPPYLIPAGFLTITVYSRLGLPSLRMVPYHSTPPTPR